MKKEKWFPIVKWGIYYAILFLLYILQTTPNLFSVFGVKPLLVFLPVIPVCMFEKLIPSAVYGMVAGFFLDLSQNTLFGFNALVLLVFSAAISLVCVYYLHPKFINALWFSAVTILLQEFLYYLFCYSIWGFANRHIILLRHILPSVLYTVILVPLSFVIIKKLNTAFTIEERI